MKLVNQEIKKIGVFRALQLGDMLCSVPAFRALRKAYPAASISLIGLQWASSFVQRFSHYLDRFISFPGYPGLPEQELNAVEVLHFLKMMQAEEFDLIIQMQGNGSYVNPLTELFNSRYLAGYYQQQDYCPDENLFMIYPNRGSEIERHLSLMSFLGIPNGSNALEFPITEKDITDFKSLNQDFENKYVCVHPGSRGAWRQWPPEHFALVADICYLRGYTVFLTGTGIEKSLTEQVKNLMKYPSVNLAGKTSLGALGVVISKANLLISNCTGVSHMASAFKTPSIVISMDGEPQRWAPLNTSIHRTANWLQNTDLQAIMDNVKLLLDEDELIRSR